MGLSRNSVTSSSTGHCNDFLGLSVPPGRAVSPPLDPVTCRRASTSRSAQREAEDETPRAGGLTTAPGSEGGVLRTDSHSGTW